MFVSPALQRGEKGFHNFVTESRRDGAHDPIFQHFLWVEGKTQTAIDSRKCQTATATQAKPGVLPIASSVENRQKMAVFRHNLGLFMPKFDGFGSCAGDERVVFRAP
jgi:hypothetical protein